MIQRISAAQRTASLDDEQRKALLMIASGAPLPQCLDALTEAVARLAEAGTPETMTSNRGEVTEARDQVADERKGIKFLGKNLKKLFQKKQRAGGG